MHLRFSHQELEEFSDYLNHEYGLKFTPSKFQTLENRILPVLAEFKCNKLSDAILQCKKNIKLRMDLLNALTTNETWFFRHPAHYKILTKKILPEIVKRAKLTGDNRIKIWSAGCSIGAELFSVMITVLEYLEAPEDWNLNFIGSDISSDSIALAKKGKFTKQELRLVDQKLLAKYFSPCGNDCFKVKPEIANLAEFEILNLLESWPARKLDIIFCRNVLIYFDENHKQKITEKFLKALNNDGYYLTSANESIHWETDMGLQKLFFENEYIYQKSKKKEQLKAYQFKTPSDLLRALNLLNQSAICYELQKINQTHHLAPKRAIYISQTDSIQADELFSLSSIKIFSKKPVSK